MSLINSSLSSQINAKLVFAERYQLPKPFQFAHPVTVLVCRSWLCQSVACLCVRDYLWNPSSEPSHMREASSQIYKAPSQSISWFASRAETCHHCNPAFCDHIHHKQIIGCSSSVPATWAFNCPPPLRSLTSWFRM